jgi:3',5'-cyclic AMP phosphodiesterase CpdA
VRNAECGVRSTIHAFAVIIALVFPAASFATQDQQIQQKLAALEKIGPSFSFIVLGDNRSGDDIYRRIVSLAMERKPAFIVNIGDMIATPGDLEQWARFWELSKPVTVPYFLTVGNHDIDSRLALTEQQYREQVDLPGNELYYSFVAGNSLFIILDSSLYQQGKKIIGGQFTWLEKTLANSDKKHKFVFVHHPLYPEKGQGKHYGNSLDRYEKERNDLQALFARYKVRIVFTGHDHLYIRKTVGGILHVITGGAGAPLYATEEEGGFHHLVRVSVDGDNVNAEAVDVNGRIRDSFAVK